MQDLNLPVGDLLGRPGEYRDFTVSPVLTQVRNALARLSHRPIDADLRAESVVEGILITGTVNADGDFQCARCLASFDLPLSLELCELYVAPGHEGPPDEDNYKVSAKEVHLEPMLRDAITLALPLNPICREDCAGLCSGCGRNLNTDASICVHEETDPRWAELAVLRERLQG